MPVFNPSSATANLAVVVPTTLTASVPPTVKPGDPVPVVGRLTRNDTGAGVGGKTINTFPSWGGSGTTLTDADGFYRITHTAPTAEGTYSITAKFAGDTQFGPSEKTVSFQVKLFVDTTTTLSLSPPSANPSQTVTASGRLTRNDTGAGLSGFKEDILLAGVLIGTAITDANGNYSFNLTAPATPGSYTVKAQFLGATTAGEVFGPSSRQVGLAVGIAAIVAPLTAIASLLGGVTLAFLSSRRR